MPHILPEYKSMLWIKEGGLQHSLSVRQWIRAGIGRHSAFSLAVWSSYLAFSKIKYKFINEIEKKGNYPKGIPVCTHIHLFLGFCRLYKISLTVHINEEAHFSFSFVQPCNSEKQWHYTLLNIFQTQASEWMVKILQYGEMASGNIYSGKFSQIIVYELLWL